MNLTRNEIEAILISHCRNFTPWERKNLLDKLAPEPLNWVELTPTVKAVKIKTKLWVITFDETCNVYDSCCLQDGDSFVYHETDFHSMDEVEKYIRDKS